MASNTSAIGEYFRGQGYEGPYMYPRSNNIYVHLKTQHFLRHEGDINVESITSLVKSYKQEALNASKTQYKRLFLESINDKQARILKEIYQNDDVMSKVQMYAAKKLQEALPIDKLTSLMQIQRDLNVPFLAEKIYENKAIYAFNNLIKTLCEAVKLIESPDSQKLMKHLANAKLKRTVTTKGLGSRLIKALSDYEKQQSVMSQLDIDRMNQIVRSIKALGNALYNFTEENEETGQKESLTAAGLMKIIDAIFNTGFAEVFASMIKGSAYVNIEKELKGSLSGMSDVKIQFTDAFGSVIQNFNSLSKSGKADAKLSNVQITIDDKINNLNGKLNINLGISNKFYRTQYFPPIDRSNKRKTNFGEFSSGSAGTLGQALLATFSGNLRALYYSYNAFSHSGDFGSTIIALKDVIATRQVVRAFASRGGIQDFAQFMFINGQIIPIWTIIQNSMNTLNLAESALKLQIKGEEGITLIAETQLATPLDRITAVNKAIGDAVISMQLDLNHLIYYGAPPIA